MKAINIITVLKTNVNGFEMIQNLTLMAELSNNEATLKRQVGTYVVYAENVPS